MGSKYPAENGVFSYLRNAPFCEVKCNNLLMLLSEGCFNTLFGVTCVVDGYLIMRFATSNGMLFIMDKLSIRQLTTPVNDKDLVLCSSPSYPANSILNCLQIDNL